MSVSNLCQAGRASACPLANRESEQTAPRDALLFGSWQCITYADKCNIKRFALSGLVHPHSDACVQTVLPRSCIYVSSFEAYQAAPCVALVPGSWQCTTHAEFEAVAQAFGTNAPKRPCLCAICAKQAMHLRVILPIERANRLHHATLCCLGAGNASHTQINVTLSDSPSRT